VVYYESNGTVAEQADARDLKSLGFKNRAGSIPAGPILEDVTQWQSATLPR
jgi:hypothetical protein